MTLTIWKNSQISLVASKHYLAIEIIDKVSTEEIYENF